jgi:RNA polymerase sigma-70 factor (ECF subfamily)
MRAQWERVREALVQSTVTLQAEHLFRELGRYEPLLSSFEGPSELVSFLTSAVGDLDRKDSIYATLVRTVQSRSGCSELATSLVWLGLWPGLDGVYRRNLRFFPGAPEELVSEISDLLTSNVAGADLTRIHRPAATLTRNVQRDLRRRLRQAWNEERRRADLPQDDLLDTDDIVEGPWAVDPSPDNDVQPLRAWVDAVVETDRRLLERVFVLGETQKEAAAHLGMSHDAARKRYRRALDRLSHFAPRTGVSQRKGERRP